VQAGPQVDAAPADRRWCVWRRPRIRAGYAWQPPCPVPLVGEGPEGAAPPPRQAFARGATPVALGRRRAWPPLVGKESGLGAAPSLGLRTTATPGHPAARRHPAVPPARCRISRGPRSTAGRVRHRRGEREEDKGGEERGNPDRGLISSNFEGLFAK